MKIIKTENVNCPYCCDDEYVIIARGKDFECNLSNQEFTMVRCKKCGLIRLNPRPKINELNFIYSPTYNAYIFESKLGKLMKFFRNYYLRRMIIPLKKIIPNNATVLEGGCGDGEFLLNLKKYGSFNWKLIGNDISETAKEKLENASIEFHPGRFEDLDKKDKFDVVILKDVIEHLDQPGKVFKDVSDKLKLNGLFIIETPNPDSWDAHIFRKRYWAGWHFPRHWTIYNKSQINEHLIENGFEIIKITPNLSPVSWLYSIKYYLSEKKFFTKFAFLFDERFFISAAFFYFINLLQIILTNETSNMQIFARKVKNE